MSFIILRWLGNPNWTPSPYDTKNTDHIVITVKLIFFWILTLSYKNDDISYLSHAQTFLKSAINLKENLFTVVKPYSL